MHLHPKLEITVRKYQEEFEGIVVKAGYNLPLIKQGGDSYESPLTELCYLWFSIGVESNTDISLKLDPIHFKPFVSY